MDTPHRHHLPTPKKTKNNPVVQLYQSARARRGIRNRERDERSRLDVMFL